MARHEKKKKPKKEIKQKQKQKQHQTVVVNVNTEKKHKSKKNGGGGGGGTKIMQPLYQTILQQPGANIIHSGGNYTPFDHGGNGYHQFDLHHRNFAPSEVNSVNTELQSNHFHNQMKKEQAMQASFDLYNGSYPENPMEIVPPHIDPPNIPPTYIAQPTYIPSHHVPGPEIEMSDVNTNRNMHVPINPSDPLPHHSSSHHSHHSSAASINQLVQHHSQHSSAASINQVGEHHSQHSSAASINQVAHQPPSESHHSSHHSSSSSHHSSGPPPNNQIVLHHTSNQIVPHQPPSESHHSSGASHQIHAHHPSTALSGVSKVKASKPKVSENAVIGIRNNNPVYQGGGSGVVPAEITRSLPNHVTFEDITDQYKQLVTTVGGGGVKRDRDIKVSSEMNRNTRNNVREFMHKVAKITNDQQLTLYAGKNINHHNKKALALSENAIKRFYKKGDESSSSESESKNHRKHRKK